MRGWSILFWCAAAFNLLVGLAVMVMPQAASPTLAGDAAALLAVRTVGWLVLVFGIGYAIVATDPLRHAGIVRIGVIGKLGVFVITLLAWQAGMTTAAQAVPAFVDLPWAIAFIVFLTRKANAA